MNKIIAAAAVLACSLCSGTVSAQNASAGVKSGPEPNRGQSNAARRGLVLNGLVLNGLVLNGRVLQGIQFNGIVLNGRVLQGTGADGVTLYGPLPQYLDPTAADASAPRSDWSALRLDRISVRLAQPAR